MWPRPPGHRHPLDRHVVGLGAAGGEHDLLLADPQEVGDLLARGLEPSRASRPKPCTLDGLPNRSLKYGSIASTTSGCTGVEAL